MKKTFFEILYICLGILAFVVRKELDANEINYYMSIINQIAGCATLLIILLGALNKILSKIKEKRQSKSRCANFIIFSLIILIVYWSIIIGFYEKYDANLMNDLVTICSLTLALTNDIFEGVLVTIFYKG